jgi:alpha-beta hydrolase superfamily lysophospholipase
MTLSETLRASWPGTILSPMAADVSHPVWFGPEREPLFGMYHPGRDTSTRRLAIALCPPFGYEAMCAYRPYVRLAEMLAAQGFPVLRFDYHGTGSSAGDDLDPDRLGAWVRSIHAAIDRLRELSGCTAAGLFGARLGATLAALAAENRPEVRALVLWGPTLNGSAFLREEFAVHKLRAQQHHSERATDGSEEAIGFALSRETLHQLKGLNLASLTHAPPAALVLSRDTPLHEPRVAQCLERLGASVIAEPAPGYAALLATSRAPQAVWTRIAHYFDEQERALPDDLPQAHEMPPPKAASALFWPQTPAPGPASETPSWFGPKRSLFGILTEPPEPAIDAPLVVLLSGGVNPQVGTNRMHTRWARDWAQLGLSTFRFDLSGIGDSATAAGAEDAQLYSLQTVDEVRAALDHLEREYGARRFMLIGLCSGAFAAFHTALADRRVSDIGLLNLLRYYWSPDDSIEQVQAQRRHQLRSLRYYVGALARPAHWLKLVRGNAQFARIGKSLATRSARRAVHAGQYWLARVRGEDVVPSHPLARDFRALAQRGVTSLVVYNGDEPTLDDFQEQLGTELPRLQALGRLQLQVIDGADHIVSPIASQHALSDRLTEYMRERLLGQVSA